MTVVAAGGGSGRDDAGVLSESLSRSLKHHPLAFERLARAGGAGLGPGEAAGRDPPCPRPDTGPQPPESTATWVLPLTLDPGCPAGGRWPPQETPRPPAAHRSEPESRRCPLR